jgi:ADP-ribosylglycohydrolase
MRVSPLGILGWSSPPDVVAGWARADAVLTHANPACGDASALYVVALAHAVRTGASPKEILAHVLAWGRGAGVRRDLLAVVERAAEAPPEDYVRQMGWVRIALQNAFHRLLHARSVEEGVVETVRAGGDADTNAAIAGALLGAVGGVESIPVQWADRVLSCRPLAGAVRWDRVRPSALWPVDVLVVAEQLAWLGRTSAG